MNMVEAKNLLKRRAYRALLLRKDSAERKLLSAIIYQAIDDFDRPDCEPIMAIKLLNSWYPNWVNDFSKIKAALETRDKGEVAQPQSDFALTHSEALAAIS